ITTSLTPAISAIVGSLAQYCFHCAGIDGSTRSSIPHVQTALPYGPGLFTKQTGTDLMPVCFMGATWAARTAATPRPAWFFALCQTDSEDSNFRTKASVRTGRC